ncbi:MAG: glycosyltransferase family 4 protein [Candidatus Hodarchaeota archaeon]
MKPKIINIIPHPPPYDLYHKDPRPPINWDTPDGSWVGIWGYDWADLLGNELLKSSDEFKYEVWQPDLRADKTYSYTFESGLVHKLFPARKKSILTGLKIKREIYSDFIINGIGNLDELNNNILLHLSAQPDYMYKLIQHKFYNRLPIVYQFLGDASSLFEYKTSKNILIRFHRKLILENNENFFSKCRNVFYCVKNNDSILRNYIKANFYYRIMGVDFNFWKRDTNKSTIREFLKIPEDKFILFSSSRLNNLKQIDKLIKALSQINNNFFIFYISGHGEKDYENYLKKLIIELKLYDKVIFLGYVTDDILKSYYLASDVFISTSLKEGGPMSVMKALALEVPVIVTDTGISYLLKERNAGIILPSEYCEWATIIESVINGRLIKTIPREEVKQMFSWDVVAINYLNSYRKIYKNFYK